MAAYSFRIKKSNLVTGIILLLVYLGSILSSSFKRLADQPKIMHIGDSAYIGSASCVSCHKDIAASHIKTAHYLTSRPAAAEYIKGSFDSGRNSFRYNKLMEVVMEKKDGDFFQTAYAGGIAYQSEPIDVVIGSGRKGQTYLYWNNNKLFQLPVSYYVPLKSWCNSPGYSTKLVQYDRAIPAHCIECHGTYAKTSIDKDGTTIFDQNAIIYGVDCERCHGPAAAHVIYHSNHPDEKIAKYIINPKLLTRQQRLDACALCHSGLRKEIKPAFSFMEGDTLDNYSLPGYDADSASLLDVHGNQYGLLTSSKCFKSTKEMDCSSCHNIHTEEVNVPKIFSQRCMNCHNNNSHDTCTFTATPGLTLSDNCVDCHMPLLASKKIFLQLDDPKKSTPDFVRTHRIGIYLQQTKEFVARIKNK